MRVGTQEDKLFKKEIGVFNHYRNFYYESKSPGQMQQGLGELTTEYKSLLDQTRFLTWISGRLEKKLQRSNRELNDRNTKLENALSELVKVTAGRNAYVIIYCIAIVLFVLEEFFVEPVISMFGEGLGLSIIIKLGIVIILKISEGIIEDRIKKKPKLQSIETIKPVLGFGKV